MSFCDTLFESLLVLFKVFFGCWVFLLVPLQSQKTGTIQALHCHVDIGICDKLFEVLDYLKFYLDCVKRFRYLCSPKKWKNKRPGFRTKLPVR